MELRIFSGINRARCESLKGFGQPLDSWTISDWFTATLGELGEAANVAKKIKRIQDGIRGNKETEEELKEKLEQELADTFIYLDLLCQAAGIDLNDAVMKTFNKKSDELGFKFRVQHL